MSQSIFNRYFAQQGHQPTLPAKEVPSSSRTSKTALSNQRTPSTSKAPIVPATSGKEKDDSHNLGLLNEFYAKGYAAKEDNNMRTESDEENLENEFKDDVDESPTKKKADYKG